MSDQLHAFENDTDIVIAASADDAMSVWEEQFGEKRADYPDMKWKQLDDDKPLTIHSEDDGKEHTKIRREWAAENGRGYLASTEGY